MYRSYVEIRDRPDVLLDVSYIYCPAVWIWLALWTLIRVVVRQAMIHARHVSSQSFPLQLLTFDKHNGSNVIMSALEDVVNSGDDEHSAKHGGRPVPVFECQPCVLTKLQRVRNAYMDSVVTG